MAYPGHISTSVCEYVNMWIWEYVNTWICEYVNMWICEYVNTWIYRGYICYVGAVLDVWRYDQYSILWSLLFCHIPYLLVLQEAYPGVLLSYSKITTPNTDNHYNHTNTYNTHLSIPLYLYISISLLLYFSKYTHLHT